MIVITDCQLWAISLVLPRFWQVQNEELEVPMVVFPPSYFLLASNRVKGASSEFKEACERLLQNHGLLGAKGASRHFIIMSSVAHAHASPRVRVRAHAVNATVVRFLLGYHEFILS